MANTNFEFLKEYDNKLFNMAIDTENLYRKGFFCQAGTEIRKILERLVDDIYKTLKFSPPTERKLYNYLSNNDFCEYFNNEEKNGSKYLDKMHFIRQIGNRMTHESIEIEMAKNFASRLLLELFKLTLWWFTKKFTIRKKISFCSLIYNQNQEANKEQQQSEKNNFEPQNQEETKDSNQQFPIASNTDFSKHKIAPQSFLCEAKCETEQYQSNENDEYNAEYQIETNFLPEYKHLIDAYSSFNLNVDQKEAVFKLDHFLRNPNGNIFILNGKAGSGKTFLASGLINYLISKDICYKVAAPTGKAAKNIASKTNTAAYTIHKMIYKYDPNIDQRNYDIPENQEVSDSILHLEMVLRYNDDPENTVYIIDEASMIGDNESEESKNGEIHFGSGKLLKDLLQYVGNRRIVFIGDGSQLLPINYEGKHLPPALDSIYLQSKYPELKLTIETATLNTIVRQSADSAILKIASQIRLCMQKNQYCLKYDFNNPDIIDLCQSTSILDEICKVYQQDLDKTIVITYSNKFAYDYNRAIRAKLLGFNEYSNPPLLVEGDKIIVTKNNYYYEYFLMNGSIGYIKSFNPNLEKRTVSFYKKKPDNPKETEKISINLLYADAVVEFPGENENLEINVKLLMNSINLEEGTLSRDIIKAQHIEVNRRFSGIKDKAERQKLLNHDPYFNALIIKYAYAITCHKSQGSEWANVFVHCNGYSQRAYEYKSDGYFRWFYTAVTRSKEKLYLIKPVTLN